MAVLRMLNAPITAAGGSDVLVALGSGPFLFVLFVGLPGFLFVDCMGRYAFLTGGNAFLPNADMLMWSFAAYFCTAYGMFSFLCFGLRWALAPFSVVFVLLFLEAKRKSGWGICGSSAVSVACFCAAVFGF